MITNDVKDPVKALEIYRRKDSVEKAFDDLKNDLDCKRLRIHSSAAMEGRFFLQYLALILTTRIRLTLNSADLPKKYDLQQVINEMKSLRLVWIDGTKKALFSKRSAFQDCIVKLFGISCIPVYNLPGI
jgi:transposase